MADCPVSQALAWMIITFGVEPGSEQFFFLEAFFCIIPGFAFYQGIGNLEVRSSILFLSRTWQLHWSAKGRSSHWWSELKPSPRFYAPL